MSWNKYYPPPNSGCIYIKPNRRNAAIPNKGIAAFFRSTEFYVLYPIPTCLVSVYQSPLIVFQLIHGLLFDLLTDKPCPNCLHCRSPPSPFAFEPISKTEWAGRKMLRIFTARPSDREERQMSQKQHYINIKGTLVEVNEEQYLCYYRAKRRMRYYEQDIKIETAVHDRDGNITGYKPSKEDSLERIISTGMDFADEQESALDTMIHKFTLDKLYEALGQLSETERELIDTLFFSNDANGMSERSYSTQYGVPQKTVNDRKHRILGKLKKILENH